MDRKYQISVSSTYEDLKEERNEVIKACLNMGHIPVGMEMFNAADEEQWAVITRTIEQCDYYVVIVAHRYGSTTPEGISFTEKEYNYAIAQGVPVLGFVIEDGALWPNDRIDKDEAAVKALRNFKSKVKQKMVRLWRDKSELQAHFAMSLTTYIHINPRRGWVRAPEAEGADIAQTLSNLTEENARLRDELKEASESTNATQDEIGEIIAIISPHELRCGDKQVAASDFLLHLIEAIQKSEMGWVRPDQIAKHFGLDHRDFADFVDQLHFLNVIGRDSAGDYTLSTLSKRIYIRLLLQKQSK